MAIKKPTVSEMLILDLALHMIVRQMRWMPQPPKGGPNGTS